ncbi:MAG TPA: c-type cytochrome [Gammaproteobacteria bacterium]|nr:c-type cytochrome [Gammaproteobacteria bacterium]
MRQGIWAWGGAVLALATLPLTAAAAGDPQAGKKKAYECLGCHGSAGYGNVYPAYHVPKVGGQQAQYIAAALKAYRSGERRHPTMRAQAMALSNQDIQDIAAYFAGLGDGSSPVAKGE